MQLQHGFVVPVGVEQAWTVLTDIERIAPCLPGAALDSVDGDEFTGTVKVRLGPIGLTYKGKARFVERDDVAHQAVIDAQGRDARGNGTASATITATLAAEGALSTTVTVLTELRITGKPAQFGRGVMVDVGNKLIGQFADCLAGTLAEPITAESAAVRVPPRPGTISAATEERVGPSEAAATTPATPTDEPGARPTASAVSTSEVEAIDLLGSAGPALAKRLLPALGPVLLLVLLWRRRRIRRSGQSPPTP